MTSDEATVVARRHLQENPFPEEGFRWTLDPGTCLAEGWYFDYRFERVQGLGDLPLYAGAKGFHRSARRPYPRRVLAAVAEASSG